MSSMPTESRSNAGIDGQGRAGQRRRGSCGAGCSMSDSTAPSDSARVNIDVDAATAKACGSPPRTVNETIPPKRRICGRAVSWPSCPGSPG